MISTNSNFKKFLRFFLTRLPFAIVLGLLIMAGSLKLVEKYPVPLKEGFEKFLSEKTKTNATIGTLEKITFIPSFDVQMRNLTMHNRDNAGVIDLEIKEINFEAPAWSIFLNGKRITRLEALNIKANADILAPHLLEITSMKIEDRNGPEQYGSFLVATGKYAGHKMDFEAAIEKSGNNYKITNQIPFNLQLDNYAVTGTYQKKFSGVWMNEAVFSKGNSQSETQDYLLMKSGDYNRDNPLACLVDNKELNVCDKYLEKKDNKS
jgi:hypothetical protein